MAGFLAFSGRTVVAPGQKLHLTHEPASLEEDQREIPGAVAVEISFDRFARWKSLIDATLATTAEGGRAAQGEDPVSREPGIRIKTRKAHPVETHDLPRA